MHFVFQTSKTLKDGNDKKNSKKYCFIMTSKYVKHYDEK